VITRTHAIAIANKLDARREARAGYELAVIRHDGVKVAWFAIRNASRGQSDDHCHVPPIFT
jgi:hypothetical protein